MYNLQKALATYSNHPDIKPELIWSLIGVDYEFIFKQMRAGILDFEDREPGCIGALARAFLCMLDLSQDRHMRLNILEAKTAAQQDSLVTKLLNRLTFYNLNCADVAYSRNKEGMPINRGLVFGQLRQRKVCYGFVIENTIRLPKGSLRGFKYLQERTHIRGPIKSQARQNIIKYYTIAANDYDFGDIKVYQISCEDQKNIHPIANIIRDLNLRLIQDLQQTHIEDERYKFIAEYIQDLMCLHPFYDFNNRVLVSLLLNEILFDLGYSPVVLMQPNVFDGFTPDELVVKIKEGQTLLREICAQERDAPKEYFTFDLALFMLAIDSGDARLIKMSLHSIAFSKDLVALLIATRKQYLKELTSNLKEQKIRSIATNDDFIQVLLKQYKTFSKTDPFTIASPLQFKKGEKIACPLIASLFHLMSQQADYVQFLYNFIINNPADPRVLSSTIEAAPTPSELDKLQIFDLKNVMSTLSAEYISAYLYERTSIQLDPKQISIIIENRLTLAACTTNMAHLIIQPSFMVLLGKSSTYMQKIAVLVMLQSSLDFKQIDLNKIHTACLAMLKNRVEEKFVLDFFFQCFDKLHPSCVEEKLNTHFNLIQSLMFVLKDKQLCLDHILERLPKEYAAENPDRKELMMASKNLIFTNFPKSKHQELLTKLETTASSEPTQTSMVCWRKFWI